MPRKTKGELLDEEARTEIRIMLGKMAAASVMIKEPAVDFVRRCEMLVVIIRDTAKKVTE